MEHEQYVGAIRREGDALANAARTAGIDATVPSCSDWQIADLLEHIGRIHVWVTGIVTGRPEQPALHWRQTEAPARAERLDWFVDGYTALADALGAAAPDEEVWTWAPDRNIRFWSRRMAHELAVHRWDAQTAIDEPQPVERDLAVDGVQEAFDLVPLRMAANPPTGNGETIHLHCTDGDGEWLLRLDPDGFVVTNEHAKGDVAARGTASDLLLLVWGRIGADDVEVFGDASLIARWQELARF